MNCLLLPFIVHYWLQITDRCTLYHVHNNCVICNLQQQVLYYSILARAQGQQQDTEIPLNVF